jgi:hypothetical protein
METMGDRMTKPSDGERGEMSGSGSWGVCSVCVGGLLPGQLVVLDTKPHTETQVGDEWFWYHAACSTLPAQPE